jgi:hypothetical protein
MPYGDRKNVSRWKTNENSMDFHHCDAGAFNNKELRMILSQGKLADCLVDDLLEAIHKYDETLYMATVIGVLELVKQQLINESVENEDDDD